MKRLIHRMNQTAHISLQKLSISKSVETKETVCALTCLARPASNTSNFSLCFPPRPSAFPLQCGSFRVPLALLFAAVEGVLRLVTYTRNPFFRENAFFVKLLVFRVFSGGCLPRIALDLGSNVILLLAQTALNTRFCVIHRLTPKTPKDSMPF